MGMVSKVRGIISDYGMVALLKDKRFRPHNVIGGYFRIARSPLFDASFYKEKYGFSRLFAPLHYYLFSLAGLNDPSPAFSTRNFVQDYEEINETKWNPLVVYEKGKKTKGYRYYRGTGDCDLYPYYLLKYLFDGEWYMRTYLPDRRMSEINPIEHYAETGWKDGNLPFEDFDIGRFEKEHPECDISPLEFILKNRILDGYFKDENGPYALKFRKEIIPVMQDRNVRIVHPNSKDCKKIILFMMTPDDVISGGLMSIAGMYEILKEIKGDRFDDVVAINLPWRTDDLLYQFSLFDTDLRMFRYDHLQALFPNVEEMLIMIPEIYIKDFGEYLKKNPDSYFLQGRKVHLNVMDQNIELMPFEIYIDTMKTYFDEVTQTVAHKKYCTQHFREVYDVPSHLLIPPIRKKFTVRPYEEKEEIFAYSYDLNPYKNSVINAIKKKYPNMRFVEIIGLKFRDYLELISKAKWVMSFGEGLDGYFSEPYYSGTISFSVWNERFFTEAYHGLPTVFEDYDDTVARITDVMAALDNKEDYERTVEQVREVHKKDYALKESPEDQLESFLQKRYDFP